MLTTRRLFQFVLLCALVALALRPVADGDFWWHLKTGLYILDTRSIPHQDIFSFTRLGAEWVTHEWLSEVLIAALYRAGGFPLLIVTFAAIIGGSFFVAFRRAGGDLFAAALVTVVGALATSVLWDVRPQMVALALTSVALWILDHYQRDPETRLIWLLVPLTVIWANAHGSFPLALALAGLVLVGGAADRRLGRADAPTWRALRNLLIVIAAMLMVISLNPNGIRLYTYPLETLAAPATQSQIVEWQSPDFHRADMLPLLLLIVALPVSLAFRERRPPMAQLLLAAVTLFAALRSVRLVPLFALTAIPLMASAVTFRLSAFRSARPRLAWLNWVVAALILFAVSTYGLSVMQKQDETSRLYFPVRAVDALRSEVHGARVFNSYEWGGYLIYRLYPRQPVFIDGRSDVYTVLIDEYLTIYRAAPGWQDLIGRYSIDIVLVPPQAPLAARLAEDRAWRLTFQDERAVMYVRQ